MVLRSSRLRAACLTAAVILFESVLRRTSFDVNRMHRAHCLATVYKVTRGSRIGIDIRSACIRVKRFGLGRDSTAQDVLENLDVDFRGRTAIITGAQTGLGLETCKALASRGCRVLLCCLDQEVGAAAVRHEIMGTYGVVGYDSIAQPDVKVLTLDLSDFSSIEHCAAEILGQESSIDMLVLNAGVCGAQGQTKQGLEPQMGINHIGHALLCRHLLPAMKTQAVPSRIVVVSSFGHKFGILDPHDLQCAFTKLFG